MISSSPKQFKFAAWLTIASVIISFYYMIFMAIIEMLKIKPIPISIFDLVLMFLDLGAGIYVLLILKKLLNTRFAFFDANRLITAMIFGNVILSVLAFPVLVGKRNLSILIMLLVFGILYLIFGVIYIKFARRIRRMPGDLFGLLKPFYYTALIAGILNVSIIFTGLLSQAAGIVNTAIMAMIFFRAAKEPVSKNV
jgi:hypothetical protein